MTSERTKRPEAFEHGAYYGQYIAQVPDGDILETLRRRGEETAALALSLGEAKGNHRYAPGKWSVKQVFGHLIDGERVFVYRALRFARGDGTPLAGFEQDDYVAAGGFEERSLADLADEFRHVRAATIAFFAGLPDDAWSRRGTANNAETTVRAFPWILAGHEIHHVGVLRKRYL